MPTDMPPPTDIAARVQALRDRLDEIGESLDSLLAERTSVTRELAALWVQLDLDDVPAAAERPAPAAADTKTEPAAKPASKASRPKSSKAAARRPKNKQKG
jgi:hypothetical protein